MRIRILFILFERKNYSGEVFLSIQKVKRQKCHFKKKKNGERERRKRKSAEAVLHKFDKFFEVYPSISIVVKDSDHPLAFHFQRFHEAQCA
jgi:hypothetical protein